jgi:chorismate synthase
MRDKIDEAIASGDTLGGVCELVITGVVPGIGNFTSWHERLDAKIAGALMSIPAVKAVEIGTGFKGAHLPGSLFHDALHHSKKHGFYRKTNNAGGIEGGMSNGEPITVKVMVKPVPTLTKGLASVNVATKEQKSAHSERHDTVVVSSCGVIADAMASFVLADGYLKKFGGDSLKETKVNFLNYCSAIKDF